MHKKFSISEAIKFGWNQALNHIGFFVMALLGAWILSLIPQALSEELSNGGLELFATLASIAGFLVGCAISLGFIKTVLRMIEGGEPTLEDFRPDWPQYWQFVGATILFSIIVGIGFVLLIVPGFIALVAFQFYGYFLVEKGMRPVDALKASFHLTKGERGRLFLFFLASIAISILGAIALVIGLFAAIPTVLLAQGYIYGKLRVKVAEVEPATA